MWLMILWTIRTHLLYRFPSFHCRSTQSVVWTNMFSARNSTPRWLATREICLPQIGRSKTARLRMNNQWFLPKPYIPCWDKGDDTHTLYTVTKSSIPKSASTHAGHAGSLCLLIEWYWYWICKLSIHFRKWQLCLRMKKETSYQAASVMTCNCTSISGHYFYTDTKEYIITTRRAFILNPSISTWIVTTVIKQVFFLNIILIGHQSKQVRE